MSQLTAKIIMSAVAAACLVAVLYVTTAFIASVYTKFMLSQILPHVG